MNNHESGAALADNKNQGKCALVNEPGGVERRASPDRRQNHAKAFFVQFVKPRRRTAGRRSDESTGYHGDFHDSKLLLVVLLTMALCIVDAYATLALLQLGGVELNPLMRGLINSNVWVFFVFKYLLTAACLAVLLSYKKFRVYRNFTAMHTLYGALAIYVLLVLYEIKLLAAAVQG